MSERADGFLARWSRRKIEVRQDEAGAPALRPEKGDAPVPADDPEVELTPEEIEALPKIEDLTPETDITAFLRKGVPEFLKNAALRRTWSLDPAIRDHVGDARDYAYDWNVPGGVPGNGPLLPADDVAAMLRGMFPEDAAETEVADALDGSTRATSQTREHAESTEAGNRAPDASRDGPAREGTEVAGESNALSPSAIAASDTPGMAPLEPESEAETARAPRPGRHGGAKPV